MRRIFLRTAAKLVIAPASGFNIWTLIMRFSPAAITLSLLLATASSMSVGKKIDYAINPQSLTLSAQGDAALKTGDKDSAMGWYETALAVDPLNRAAYVGLAQIAYAQGLKGKAIRFYREALEIDPNDQQIIAAQGDVAKGALEAAQKNLARLRQLCRADCSAADRIAIAIDKAKEKPAVQASAVEIKAVEIKPVVDAAGDKKN
jgi:tetratricopeptide (TPR) repeat protein